MLKLLFIFVACSLILSSTVSAGCSPFTVTEKKKYWCWKGWSHWRCTKTVRKTKWRCYFSYDEPTCYGVLYRHSACTRVIENYQPRSYTITWNSACFCFGTSCKYCLRGGSKVFDDKPKMSRGGCYGCKAGDTSSLNLRGGPDAPPGEEKIEHDDREVEPQQQKVDASWHPQSDTCFKQNHNKETCLSKDVTEGGCVWCTNRDASQSVCISPGNEFGAEHIFGGEMYCQEVHKKDQKWDSAVDDCSVQYKDEKSCLQAQAVGEKCVWCTNEGESVGVCLTTGKEGDVSEKYHEEMFCEEPVADIEAMSLASQEPRELPYSDTCYTSYQDAPSCLQAKSECIWCTTHASEGGDASGCLTPGNEKKVEDMMGFELSCVSPM